MVHKKLTIGQNRELVSDITSWAYYKLKSNPTPLQQRILARLTRMDT